MKNKKSFFLKFLKFLGIIAIFAGAIIGTSNEKLNMENFYSSIKVTFYLIAGGLIAIRISSILISLEKYKLPKLLYPPKSSK